MKYESGHVSENVEDRRGGGRTGLAIGGGGAIVALVASVIGQVLGVDVSGLFGGGGGGGAPAATSPDDPQLVDFVNYLVDDIQGTYADLFAKAGKSYRPAKLVLFTDEIDTGCGRSSSAIGPFYCPPDEKAYIDLTFYALLKDKLGAGGDFAQAYVLAHEFGHHVQHLLGIDREHDTRDHAQSVRFELQADCFAGVWAHSTAERKLLESGDIDEATNAAAQIGDDRLEKRAGERVNPETFTHGTSAQRVKWFDRGFEQGTFAACDTWSGPP